MTTNELRKKKKETETDCVILDLVEDGLLKDTTAKEKFHVFEVSKKISRYLSSLSFATGAISILLSAQCFLGVRLLLSLELKALFIIALGFIGVANVICGLLLLAKE